MALDIKSSLDSVKRYALTNVIKNIPIEYVNITKKLQNYTLSGSSDFRTLLDIVDYNKNIFSSTQTGAIWTLAYMDFYSLYSIMLSNYSIFNTLKNIALGKYKYVYNTYKDTWRIVVTKEIQQDYRYSFYNNFLFPRDVSLEMSKVNSRTGKFSNILETTPVVTLPAYKKNEVFPTSLTYQMNDIAISECNSDSDSNYVNIDLYRYQNNKVSIVDNITPAKEDNVYKYKIPEIQGSIAGYFTDIIYINIFSNEKINNVEKAKMQCSTDAITWSNPYDIVFDKQNDIIIENDIPLGLKVIFYSNSNLSTNDKWVISLIHTSIKDPTVDMSIRFGVLEHISYVTYMDTSLYKLNIESTKIKKHKFDNMLIDSTLFDGRIGHVVACNSQVDTIKTLISQPNYDVVSRDSKLSNRYSFKVNNIKGYVCEYEPYGTLVFNEQDVEDITSIMVDSNDMIPEYGIYNSEDINSPNIPKSFIEYNVIAENTLSKAIIPMIPKGHLNKNIYNTFLDLPSLSQSNLSLGNIGVVVEDNNNNGTYILTVSGWKRISYSIDNYLPVIHEIFIPSKVDNVSNLSDFGIASTTLRFPVDNQYILNKTTPNNSVLVYNATQESLANYNYTYSTNSTMVTKYYWDDLYVITYPVLLNSISDTNERDVTKGKWISANGNIYYMYYIDENNEIHLAIRELDQASKLLKDFTGQISGQIEMRSADKSSISPMIFDYKIGGI